VINVSRQGEKIIVEMGDNDLVYLWLALQVAATQSREGSPLQKWCLENYPTVGAAFPDVNDLLSKDQPLRAQLK